MGYREVVVPPYRIIYEAGEGGIVILRVWDGRRNPDALREVPGSEEAPPEPDPIA